MPPSAAVASFAVVSLLAHATESGLTRPHSMPLLRIRNLKRCNAMHPGRVTALLPGLFWKPARLLSRISNP